jgi:hypothetical protein
MFGPFRALGHSASQPFRALGALFQSPFQGPWGGSADRPFRDTLSVALLVPLNTAIKSPSGDPAGALFFFLSFPLGSIGETSKDTESTKLCADDLIFHGGPRAVSPLRII